MNFTNAIHASRHVGFDMIHVFFQLVINLKPEDFNKKFSLSSSQKDKTFKVDEIPNCRRLH